MRRQDQSLKVRNQFPRSGGLRCSGTRPTQPLPPSGGIWTRRPGVGLELISQPVRAPREFATAFAALAATHPDGVLVLADGLTVQRVVQIAEFAVRERLAVASSGQNQTFGTPFERSAVGGEAVVRDEIGRRYLPNIPHEERESLGATKLRPDGGSRRTLELLLPLRRWLN